MHNVAIPDQLFSEAQKRAQLEGVSVEGLVREAVKLYLGAERKGHNPLSLSPEQMESLRQADRDIDAGLGLTMNQVERNLALKKAEWLKNR